MPLKYLALLIALTSLIFTSMGQAQKISAHFGFYDIRAESQSSSGNTSVLALQRPGSYQLQAQFRLLEPLEIGIGYSLFYSKIIAGDMGFGPDISLIYFPKTAGSRQTWSQEGLSVKALENWRPFISGSFHQRQFQSIQTSYSGFGLQVGLEWAQNEQWGYVVKGGAQTLVGPGSLNFRFLDVNAGFQLYLD